MLNSLNIF